MEILLLEKGVIHGKMLGKQTVFNARLIMISFAKLS
jgi:hypothetical protein